jgi:UDP-2,4-diacetamido-2,4,6-trideoxy-beta-L-altropyranose hydrolase
MPETIIVRADASEQIGSGHLMRCLALAQAWQDTGGAAVFASAMGSPGTELRLRTEGLETVQLPVEPGSAEDAARTIALAREIGASWIVADGYHFGADYQRAVKDAGLKLLFIDDNGHAVSYCADIVLNQNLHAHAGLYEDRDADTQLLLGPRYALLRREFLQWRGWQREFPAVARKLLVTMGGGDFENVTSNIIGALPQIGVEGLEIVVVVGENNSHYEQLEAAASNSPVLVRLANSVSNMSELMVWADVVIASGGSTNWELAFLGVPSCVIVVANNQLQIAEALEAQGIVINMGWFSKVDESKLAESVENLLKSKVARKDMSRRGRFLVDGHGSRRTAAKLKDTEDEH